MNILLSTFFFDNIPFGSFYDHMCKWLVDYLPQEKINCKFLITENYYEDAKIKRDIDQYNPIMVTYEDLKKVFNEDKFNTKHLTHKVIYNNFSEQESTKFNRLMEEKLGSWKPDIIISQAHISGRNLFGSIFPNAMCLSAENGIFSRPPFGRTISYDPYSSQPINFLTEFSQELMNFKITNKQNKEVQKLKKIITNIVDKHSELDSEMRYYKKKYKKLILLPLIGDIYIELLKDCIYETEFELVEQVMRKMPKNIGVFVTQSDNWASLTLENIQYFSEKYPNFIYLQKTDIRGYSSNSLHYFKYIDAVINITSKTGYMALLWNKPVLSLAKIYNSWFKDGQGMEDLEKIFRTKYKNKNNIIYWYFTHYIIMEPEFIQQRYMYNYLEEKLDYYRKNGINFEYFNQINDIKYVHKTIEKQIREYYRDYTTQEKLIQKYEILKQRISELMKNLKNKIWNFIKKMYIIYKIITSYGS